MPSQHVFPVSELSVIDDDPLIDLHVSGHEPLLMTAEEQRAASLVRQALAAIDSFYGQLGPAQRARMAALYQIPATSTQALNAIVQRARAQVLGALTRLAGRSVDLDAVRIHTARAQGADISEPLWQWLARGTPIQLAPPRLTQDANAFVEHSWLTLAGQALARDDGQPLTIDDVISLGRELDIGATIGQQCDAWTARDDVRSTLRREADARFELALLNAMKAGHVSAQQYQQICAVAGLSLPDALSHGFTQAQSGAALHFLLRIEGHELPAVVIQTGGQTCLVADTYPEARLFMADADRDLTALQVFGEAFRADLWNTRAQREGWAWALLSPAAQQAVAARLPQPLPAANHYPPTVHWVPGAGAYVSRADYDRQASDVRFTAPYPLLRQSVALAWAQAHTQLMVRRIKQRFTPNADSSLAHAQRIGAQWLTTVLDVILIAVPGEVRFPGRGLLFKALFAKQLAVDLPLNLVQAKWAQVGETLVDFFETVLEMQAFRKAGKLHRSQLERVAGILTPVGGHGPVPDVPMNAAQHLRLLLPASLRHLDDALLDTLLQRASVDTPALIAMHQGKADMDMTLVAALSEARNRYWVEHAPALLASDDYTRLPESVEWAVLACLSDALHLRISVSDSLGMPLREFVGGEGERSTVMLVRHAGWTYRTGSGPVTDALADSLFVKIHRQRHPDSPAAEHSRLARDLRITSAEQLATGQGPYHLARALHHGPRPRGSVPVDEGRYLAATVAGASEVPPGGLRGADARAVSFECEQRVPRPGSLANLGKARHQADLAALAGTAGKAGPQTLTHTAQALYCQGLMQVLGEHGLGRTVAIRIMAGSNSVSVWGASDAPQVLVLQRRGPVDAYTYQGQLAGRDVLAPAAGSTFPLSDLVLRLLNDAARDALGIRLGDAARLNDAVLRQVPALGAPRAAEGTVLGVPALGDPELAVCVQPVRLAAAPGADGVVHEQGRHWLPWGEGAIAVQGEAKAWRVLSPSGARGPRLRHAYGEWRRLQDRLPALDRLTVAATGAALTHRLLALHRQDPTARLYHDASTSSEVAVGGARYIALAGSSIHFYRVNPTDTGAAEIEVVRPGGTGGGVWLRRDERGLWHVAQTLVGGMDANVEPDPWRPWARPGALPLPERFGLVGSAYEMLINARAGRHKSANVVYPFVRPARRGAQYARMLEEAPAALQAPTDSSNIAAKVDLFHRQWALPVDLTALPFFRMPGDISSEVKRVNGRLIADLVTAQRAGQGVITRVIEPMAGSGFYSNFVRACGYRGDLLINDLNPLVTLTQREIVQQPDAVKQHILNIKQDLLAFWDERHELRFDPLTLRHRFPTAAALTAFVNSPEVQSFREDLRHYFYSTVETQYTLVDGQIEISQHSSFRVDPINGEANARAYIAAAFYIMQSNSARHRAPVEINQRGRLTLPIASILGEARQNTVLFLPNGLSNLDGLNYLSLLHRGEQGQTQFTTQDGWALLNAAQGQSNAGDLAIISGHFSDFYVNEAAFVEQVREHVMPFVRNRGRVIITNAYSPYKEQALIALGLRVFVLESARQGFLLAMSDAVARDAGLPNG